MSLLFRKSNAANASEQRIMNKQWSEVEAMRNSAETGLGSLNTLISIIAGNDPEFSNTDLAKSVHANAGRSPADAYREMDSTTTIAIVPAGEHATLTRLISVSRSVDVGKTVAEHRMATTSAGGKTSLSGQTGIELDHVDYVYDGTIIPIHDKAFGREWREVLSMKSDGFDALVDDSREAERALMDIMDIYLWKGSDLKVKGVTWKGIKADARVVQFTLTTDLAADATSPEDIRNQMRLVRDELYIQNNCAKPLKLAVSREIMSAWERVYSNAEGVFGTIEDMVKRLRGIDEVYEDSRLVGNELALFFADREQGFHSVVGSAISTYAVKRDQHNSPFNFIKWAAAGFLAKMDAQGNKCVLFASK